MPASAVPIHVRPVTLRDVPALVQVHRGPSGPRDADGPWADPAECALAVNHRLLRPFRCFLAQRAGEVVGHAEWLQGRDPGQSDRHLYLGMLQVRADSRRQGVGRALIEHGAALARQSGCLWLRTVPEDGAEPFYGRCGFAEVAAAITGRLSTELGAARPAAPAGWRRLPSVPARVPRELSMRLGWVQASAAHMWEIANRPCRMAGDCCRHPCMGRADGRAYAQLRWWEPSNALALAWADDGVPLVDLLCVVTHLASARHIPFLLLAVRQEAARGLPAAAAPAGRVSIYERAVEATP